MITNVFLTASIIYIVYYCINCFYYYFPFNEEQSNYKHDKPLLSVLIPARNEEKNIKNAVESVLSSDSTNLECIVLDDNSTDHTKVILSQFSDKRLTVIAGKPLPKGWIGKNWACHQLSQVAKGEILLFSDADTIHSKNGLNKLIEKMKNTNADLLSGIPKQIVKTFGEAITVPFIGLLSFGALPHFLFRVKGLKWATASNGQYQCFKKTSYKELGGYKAIYNILADDTAFSRMFKSNNKKVVYTNVSYMVSSRMYTSFKEAFNGFAKSFYPTINESPLLAVIVMLAIILIFLVPYFLLFFSPSLSALIILFLSYTLWTFSCLNVHINPLVAQFHPIVPFVLMAMLINSVYSYRNNGYLWKGRKYS